MMRMKHRFVKKKKKKKGESLENMKVKLSSIGM